jgi:hypothetical protein
MGLLALNPPYSTCREISVGQMLTLTIISTTVVREYLPLLGHGHVPVYSAYVQAWYSRAWACWPFHWTPPFSPTGISWTAAGGRHSLNSSGEENFSLNSSGEENLSLNSSGDFSL